MTLKRTNKKVLEQREISKLKTDREKREKDPYRDKGYIKICESLQKSNK